MISRDWHCQNEQCGQAFHSFDNHNPPCPRCGCVRVSWIPGGGHIGKMARSVDRSLRAIAESQGMTNLNSVSPSRSMTAKPYVDNRAPENAEFGVRGFGPGFAAKIGRERHPMGDIYCSSTAANVKGSVSLGSVQNYPGGVANNAMPRTGVGNTFPGPEANAVVEAKHRRGPK